MPRIPDHIRGPVNMAYVIIKAKKMEADHEPSN